MGAESLFRKLASDEQSHPLIRAQAWTELAQMLDSAGDYDSAAQSMLHCKEILIKREAPLRQESEALQRHLHDLAESLTPGHFKKRVECGKVFSPQRLAVLTSFPRSGTTLREQVLDSHPDLISSDEREAFGRDIFPALWRSEQTPLPTASAEKLSKAPGTRPGNSSTLHRSFWIHALTQVVKTSTQTKRGTKPPQRLWCRVSEPTSSYNSRLWLF